jgi:hypothetical protein
MLQTEIILLSWIRIKWCHQNSSGNWRKRNDEVRTAVGRAEIMRKTLLMTSDNLVRVW